MKNNISKMVVPIIITIIVLLYYIFYFGIIITLVEGVLKYILGLIPLALSIVMIKVCIERINEIKKGEEDDISKY